jgi:hypothetical protein
VSEHDQPTMTCPQCKREEPDFDGFGMLSHTKPAYEHGCGYCSHPTRDGDGDGNMVCGICGDVETAEGPDGYQPGQSVWSEE